MGKYVSILIFLRVFLQRRILIYMYSIFYIIFSTTFLNRALCICMHVYMYVHTCGIWNIYPLNLPLIKCALPDFFLIYRNRGRGGGDGSHISFVKIKILLIAIYSHEHLSAIQMKKGGERTKSLQSHSILIFHYLMWPWGAEGVEQGSGAYA